MKKHDPSRRKFIQTSVATSSICFVPVMAIAKAQTSESIETTYKPQYFNPAEWDFINGRIQIRSATSTFLTKYS